MDIKDIAKEIRAVLKGAFPVTKFSVTISRFSMGESVDTSWTDGPTRVQIDDLIGKYGDTRYRFIKTTRKHSIEFAGKVIKVWKEQNPEYAHFIVTSQGKVECYGLEIGDEFNGNSGILQHCEDSIYKFLRNSTLDSLSLATPLNNTDGENKTVSVPEPELIEMLASTPQPELEPSQLDTLEVPAGTAPKDQVPELEAELLNVQELLKNTRKLADTLESEVYRLTIQITAANLAQLAKKAEIKQIILTRDEGTIAESGTTITATGWLEAERILKQWSATVISPTRADKCRIVFEFADGESFKLSSFALMQKHRFGVNLAKELLAELQYMAGEIIPAHMTRQDYENFCKFCKINPDVYKRLLNSWAIPA